MKKHEKIQDQKKWNPITIRKMLIKTICKCGIAHEVSEFKKAERCMLCKMQNNAEFANRANENGFDAAEYIAKSDALKEEMKTGEPTFEEMDEEPTDEIPVKKQKKEKSSPKFEEKMKLLLDALGNKQEWRKKTEVAEKLTGRKYGLSAGTYTRILFTLVKKGHISLKKDERGVRYGVYLKNNGTYVPGMELPEIRKVSKRPDSSPAPVRTKNEIHAPLSEGGLRKDKDIEDHPSLGNDQDQPAEGREGKGREGKGGHEDRHLGFGHAKKIEIQSDGIMITVYF